MDALAKLGINPIYLLSQLLVFSVLAYLLGKLMYNPILNMLEKRKEVIAKGLEDARAAEEARAKADEEAKTRERHLQKIRGEFEKIQKNLNKYSLTTEETMVMGDNAVAWGGYAIEVTPPPT